MGVSASPAAFSVGRLPEGSQNLPDSVRSDGLRTDLQSLVDCQYTRLSQDPPRSPSISASLSEWCGRMRNGGDY
jgi:hypothetical protein